MKCPKPGCNGVMYRFRPKHLVSAHYCAPTGTDMELKGSEWGQIGLMCDCCGYMEFYCEDPGRILRIPEGYFERTEPGE